MSPIPLPVPLLDGPPALVEARKGPVFVLLRLVRVLDTLFFLLAVPADFTRLLRVLELPLRVPLWPRPRPRLPFHVPDPERLARPLGFFNVLLFVDGFGRVCI